MDPNGVSDRSIALFTESVPHSESYHFVTLRNNLMLAFHWGTCILEALVRSASLGVAAGAGRKRGVAGVYQNVTAIILNLFSGSGRARLDSCAMQYVSHC